MKQTRKAISLRILLDLEAMQMLLNECDCDSDTKSMFFTSTESLQQNGFALAIMLEMEAAFTELRQLLRRRDMARNDAEFAIHQPDMSKPLLDIKDIIGRLMARLYVVYTARDGPSMENTSLLSGFGPYLVCDSGKRVYTKY